MLKTTQKTSSTRSIIEALLSIKRSLFNHGQSCNNKLLTKHERISADPCLPTPTDRFQFRKTIDQGQFGTVWEVQDIFTGRYLAAKSVRVMADDEPLEAMQEQHIMQALSNPGHPNIISLHYTCQTVDCHYLIMDMGGPSLRSILNTGKHFSAPEVACLMRQLLSGIAYMQKHAIQHYDITPDNLLWDGQCLKICDFGRATTQGTRQEEVLFEYMPPEILSGDNSHNVDSWSAACVMVELLLGKKLITRQQLNRSNSDIPLSRSDRNRMMLKQVKTAYRDIELCAGQEAAQLFRSMTGPLKSRVTPEVALAHPFLAAISPGRSVN